MRTSREGELTINMPEVGRSEGAIDLAAAARAILPAPGCLAVQVDPPRETHGELMLPDRVQSRLRADCGTVLAAGDGVTVRSGERVLLRPYHGLWIEPFICASDRSRTEVEGPWRVRGRCVAIEVDRSKGTGAVALPERLENSPVHTGTLVSVGPESRWRNGARVVFSRFHRRTARPGLDSIEENIVVVEDRQVYAEIDSAEFQAPMVRFYGAGTDWRKSILMVERTDRWVPIEPWMLIEREEPDRRVYLPEVHAARLRTLAKVVAVSDGRRDPLPEVAQTVIVDPDPALAIGFEMGGSETRTQLVDRRSIWAVVA